ncbi:MAG TPA: nitroreductase/quinone reductase family protein [Roseiflexaceae bacterium]|nr:nitroreductase/quinone reductase family protein [Roseiflexaceae bacterium]
MDEAHDLSVHAEDDFCYLTTTGRVSGRPHTIEIWFALNKRTIYLLAGGGDSADWVKNARRDPRVTLRLGGREHGGTARVVADPDEDALARRLVVDKYQPREDDDLSAWGRTALPVAVDLAP